MASEQNYTSHLCTFEDAMEKLEGTERSVLRYAWDVYHHTLAKEETLRQHREKGRDSTQVSSRFTFH